MKADIESRRDAATYLVNVREGMVFVWPYAVALTAAATFWSLSFESLVYFMLKHVTTSPTESAAAALFAVVVALSSSGYNFDSVLSYSGAQEHVHGAASDKAEKAGTLMEQMKWSMSGTLVDKLNILAQYYSSENFNQQYADSVQYLKDAAEYLQSQSLAQQKDVILNQLQIPYLSTDNTNDNHHKGEEEEEEVKADVEKKEALGEEEGEVEVLEETTSPGWGRHRFLYEAFSKCCSTFSGSLLPDRASIASLFQEEGVVEGKGKKNESAVAQQEEDSWKEILRKETESMQYTAWSMPLRKGLKVYRTKTVFRDATAADFVGFMTDDTFRRQWDVNSTVWDTEPKARRGKYEKKSVRLSNIYCKMKIPPPFTSRQYFLQRSVWQSEDRSEGEIICSIDGAKSGSTGNNNVTIHDYLSLCSAQTLKKNDADDGDSSSSDSVEVTFMYFEDTRLPSTLVNQIVKCRMENTLVKTEQALRMHMSLKKCQQQTEASTSSDTSSSSAETERAGLPVSRSSSNNNSEGNRRGSHREANRRKGLFGRMASVVTAACLLNRGRLVVPFILSELTRAQSRM
jgi:hypothetical protein